MIFFSSLEGRGNDGCDEPEETQDLVVKKCIALLPFLSFFISEDKRIGFDYRSFLKYEPILHSSFSRAFFITYETGQEKK